MKFNFHISNLFIFKLEISLCPGFIVPNVAYTHDERGRERHTETGLCVLCTSITNADYKASIKNSKPNMVMKGGCTQYNC